jgi:chromatin remodeling complex protein RSC6
MSTVQISNKKQTKQTKPSTSVSEPVIVVETNSTTNTVEVEVSSKKKVNKKNAKTTDDVEQVISTEQVVQVLTEVLADSENEASDPVEESFDSYDSVTKEIALVDKEIMQRYRRRAHLTKIQNKLHAKETKQLRKKSKNSDGKSQRTKSGFNKPTKVPLAFCNYLSLDPNIELPRTNVTALLYKHIKDKNMLNPEDHRDIFADKDLRTLLMMKDDEDLKFQNFQHYVARVYKAELGAVVQTGNDTVTINLDNNDEDEDEDEDDDEDDEVEVEQ